MGNLCGEKPVLQRGIPRGGSLVFLCSLTSCASPAVPCCALRAKGEEECISHSAGTFYEAPVISSSLWLHKSPCEWMRLWSLAEGRSCNASLPQSCGTIWFYSFYSASFWTYFLKCIEPNTEVTSVKGSVDAKNHTQNSHKLSLNPHCFMQMSTQQNSVNLVDSCRVMEAWQNTMDKSVI